MAPVLVVGLGITGQAVVRALRARDVPVIAVDDRPTDEQAAMVNSVGARFVGAPDETLLARLVDEVAEVLPTPGLPEHHPVFGLAQRADVGVISEFDLAARWDGRPLVAITGTNGKTTVTMMVTAMLQASGRRAAAVGNTEVPLVAALDDPDIEVFVVEASSFRLSTSHDFAPRVATWLNFAPDHLDVHLSLDAYEEAKARIWAGQGPTDVAVANAEDPVVVARTAEARGRVVTYGIERGEWRVRHGRLSGPDGEDLLAVIDLPRSLPHDVGNALAAAATAHHVGASLEAIRQVLSGWQQLPHRVQLVARRPDGVGFFDDSKATTPHAVRAALAGFGSVVLIAGGRNKGLDLSELVRGAERVRAVVAIGESADEVAATFAGVRPVVMASSMDEAVARADELARPGDEVLLSPGTASFDWYRSYGERGDDFARSVRAFLSGGEG
jgi:UDP-N-acetylmuramoylalanine--D-glutamate ligase